MKHEHFYVTLYDLIIIVVNSKCEKMAKRILFMMMLCSMCFCSCSNNDDDKPTPTPVPLTKMKAWTEKVGMDNVVLRGNWDANKTCRIELCEDTTASNIRFSSDLSIELDGTYHYSFSMLRPSTKYYYHMISHRDNISSRWESFFTLNPISFDHVYTLLQGRSTYGNEYPWENYDNDIAKKFNKDDNALLGIYMKWGGSEQKKLSTSMMDYNKDIKRWKPYEDIAYDDTVKTVYVYYPYVAGNYDRTMMKVPINVYENINYTWITFDMRHLAYAPIYLESVMAQMRVKLKGDGMNEVKRIDLYSQNISVEGLLDIKNGKIGATKYANSVDVTLDGGLSKYSTGDSCYVDRFMLPQKVKGAQIKLYMNDGKAKTFNLKDFEILRNHLCTILLNLKNNTNSVEDWNIYEESKL